MLKGCWTDGMYSTVLKGCWTDGMYSVEGMLDGRDVQC